MAYSGQRVIEGDTYKDVDLTQLRKETIMLAQQKAGKIDASKE